MMGNFPLPPRTFLFCCDRSTRQLALLVLLLNALGIGEGHFQVAVLARLSIDVDGFAAPRLFSGHLAVPAWLSGSQVGIFSRDPRAFR